MESEYTFVCSSFVCIDRSAIKIEIDVDSRYFYLMCLCGYRSYILCVLYKRGSQFREFLTGLVKISFADLAATELVFETIEIRVPIYCQPDSN